MPTAQDKTSYDIYGRQAAPVVVLVHGLGLNRQIWQWLVPELEKTHRVLTFDLLGHGQSRALVTQPTLTTLSEQMVALLDYCGIEKAAIVGFSLGGMIARRFAQDHGDRVTALGIMHSPHKRSEQAQKAIEARVEQAKQSGPSATVEAALERWFTDDYRALRPDMMDLVRTWVLANDPTIYPSLYRILAEGVDEIVKPDPPIKAPALVLTGDEDYGNGPEMSAAIAQEIEGSQLVILKGLRHMALAEDPAAFNRPLADFLGSTLGGSLS